MSEVEQIRRVGYFRSPAIGPESKLGKLAGEKMQMLPGYVENLLAFNRTRQLGLQVLLGRLALPSFEPYRDDVQRVLNEDAMDWSLAVEERMLRGTRIDFFLPSLKPADGLFSIIAGSVDRHGEIFDAKELSYGTQPPHGRSTFNNRYATNVCRAFLELSRAARRFDDR